MNGKLWRRRKMVLCLGKAKPPIRMFRIRWPSWFNPYSMSVFKYCCTEKAETSPSSDWLSQKTGPKSSYLKIKRLRPSLDRRVLLGLDCRSNLENHCRRQGVEVLT